MIERGPFSKAKFNRAPESSREPYDKEWYERFKEAGGVFDAYDYTTEGDADKRGEERRKFEAGETENPTLDYPKINPEELQRKEAVLLQLKQDIVATDISTAKEPEKMGVVRQLYRWRINEQVAALRMLQTVAKIERGEHTDKNSRRVSRYCEYIYGKPSPEVFAYTLHSLQKQLTGFMQTGNPELQKAAQELQSVLPQNVPEPRTSPLPSEEEFEAVKERVMEQLGHLINIPEGADETDSSVTVQAFEHALEKIGAGKEGWKVVKEKNRDNILVSQAKDTVFVPETQKLVQDLRGLILHEIGTHVQRRLKGERSLLLLLGTGLDRYELGEEGPAGLHQQAGEGKMEDFTNPGRHLAISLAKGLDGTPRDFRQVHDIMKKYYLVRELANGLDADSAEKRAANNAWQFCVRTFQGTDCKTPGAAFTKDIVYREGNEKTWDLVRENPDAIQTLTIGKFDANAERHVTALIKLGIIDSDLEDLEK